MRHHCFLLQVFNQEILHQYLRVNRFKIILDLVITGYLDLIMVDLADMVVSIEDLVDTEDIIHTVPILLIIIMECLVDTVVMQKIGKFLVLLKKIYCNVYFFKIIFNYSYM